MIEFVEFPKIARLSRHCVITEKIDGTNGCVYIDDDLGVYAASRTRWITAQDDNHGFARWVHENAGGLTTLGPGFHFGEWWGSGIQRGYGLPQGEKRFSLFNTARWGEVRPECCHVVPVLYEGLFSNTAAEFALGALREGGSAASPGFLNPEGVIIWHEAARIYFKKTLSKDEEYKGKIAKAETVAA